MSRTLGRKLVLLYILSAVVMFVLLNFYGVRKLEDSLVEKKKEVLYQEASIVNERYVLRFYRNQITISELIQELSVVGDFMGVRIWIVNLDGKVLGDTKRVIGTTIHILQYQEDFLEHTFLEDVYFKGVFAEPMLCVTVPIIYEYTIKGYLSMQMPMQLIRQESIYYVDFINICYLLFLGFLFFIFLYIYKITVMPLKHINFIAKQYSKGYFDQKIFVKSIDEYWELGNTLNYLGDELNQLDVSQREWIANISHDFRSPLTSIKGYVEAIQDGTIPYEMQGKYLDIIVFEVERLNKLTSHLLTLNSFNQNGMQLQMTEFDINQVIKQIAKTFEGSCKKKRLVLNLVFSQETFYVMADKDKIQQVLYNLVDNAIKFSNTDASIRITTEKRGMKAMIAVKDFGIGIPKDSISKIWERFYKTDISRGKDKKGTGLGLAIVKEIINAHKENINVISTEGVGTEFIFTLPFVEDIE